MIPFLQPGRDKVPLLLSAATEGPLQGYSGWPDACGSVGLAGPWLLETLGALGAGLGEVWAASPEALPEGSFNLLLTGPQAVLGTRGSGEEGPLPTPLPVLHQHLAAGTGGHLPTQEVWGG